MAGEVDLAEMEIAAGENAAQLLQLMEANQRSALHTWVNERSRTELAWMVLALGAGLLSKEAEVDKLEIGRGILQRQNETLDVANATLFREKRVLGDKVKELRQLNEARAAALPMKGMAAA